MEKLTQWYPPEVKPVREGVYENGTYSRRTNEITGGCYQYWNGAWWGSVSAIVSGAYRDRDEKSLYQNDPWRGLAERP